MLGFHSSIDYPAPSYLPNSCERDDLAAVLAGTKPNAIIPINSRSVKDEVFQALLKIAKNQNIHVEYHANCLFVGDKKSVDQMKETVDSKCDRSERAIKLGRLLGYSEDAIFEYVEYGIKRGMTLRDREFLRKLNRRN